MARVLGNGNGSNGSESEVRKHETIHQHEWDGSRSD